MHNNFLGRLFFLIVVMIGCNSRELRGEYYPNTKQLYKQVEMIEDNSGSFIKDGKYKQWYESGQIKIAGTYSNNKKNGNWKYWTSDGSLQIDCEYEDNINTTLLANWITEDKLNYSFNSKNVAIIQDDSVAYECNLTDIKIDIFLMTFCS